MHVLRGILLAISFGLELGAFAVADAGMILALPAITAAAAPPPQVIVFARTIGDSQLLFSIRPDGSSFRRLTRGGSNESEPVLSPDGRLIAAVGAGGIVIRARDGRLVRRTRVVVGSHLTEPRWSPGGRWIAFLAERCESPRDYGPVCADLWIVRPTSGVRRRLVEANVSTLDPAAFAWSPGGQSIVYEQHDKPGLAVVQVSSGRSRLTRGSQRSDNDPAWSRTGWIVFARQRGPFRGSDLYAVRPNGSGLRRLCRAGNAERPAASRDGRHIAFLDFRPKPDGNFWHVRVVRTNGRCSERVGTATNERTLVWSPDGMQLLWENEGERLVVGRADGRARPRVLTRGTLADWR